MLPVLILPAVLQPAAAAVLSQLPPAPPTAPPGSERGEEFGKTSPIALVVILLLLVATVLLIRSMNKRLRNVPASFDPPEDGAGPTDRAAASDGTGTSAGSGATTADDDPGAAPSGRSPGS